MLGTRFQIRAVYGGYWAFTDHKDATFGLGITSGSRNVSSFRSLSVRLGLWFRRGPPNFIVISCKSSHGSSSGDRPTNAYDDHDQDYFQASLLISETVAHYRMRKQGFGEDLRWQTSGRMFPHTVQAKESRPELGIIRYDFLRRFQSPTMFLKVSCDGDFLLPILVGEFSLEKLIDAERGDDNGDCPDQYLLVKNIVETLGYEIKMMRITKKVINTYFARLYFSQPGDSDILSVDARPSDAINVANRCKAPIYINKQIVISDAIRIGYGMGRARGSKPAYDVLLDSAADGPDLLAQEIDLVRNMNLAVQEERYSDAAMWRNKIMELRKSSHDH
ncbi:hypothetical protein K2173_006067 [Erythroxylum novogranatense]|uniref:BFN domain-containing protein n=1 Tax=Erythroxylum novogranatense TaxID=1862640 RepID=A0AAV8TC65_9ROSI|nr:hypothetical protein K2173_006067 [Erythroxylum novogranatense]